ncbi:MAG: chemotaxis protein CheW [Syntrophotalea acetylenica]|jgi:purine-binding chemotaxis protein CheW|nr:chemotaxis protein CheW [Syntrophotalea acetylenica]MDD4456688.1 chemotaxis protein CheW [Syntrophotalea acetylenica]
MTAGMDWDVAARADVSSEDTLHGKFLVFKVGNEDFGIEIRHVTEIVGIQKINEVPDLPGYMKGVINLRGKVIPVMDIRSRFGMVGREYDERTCIIVVHVESGTAGLIIDQVKEVTEIADGQIEPPPAGAGRSGQYVQGLGKVNDEVKILLDVQRLFYV